MLRNGTIPRTRGKDCIRMLHFPGLDLVSRDRERDRERRRQDRGDRRGGRDEDNDPDERQAAPHSGENMAGAPANGEQKKQEDCRTQ